MHKDVYLADQSFQETNKNQVENIVQILVNSRCFIYSSLSKKTCVRHTTQSGLIIPKKTF
jgi:hypothetical protein